MNKTLMVLLLPLALAACAPAADDPNAAANMASVDVQYMQATAGSNMFEITTSQLALNQGSAQAVKDYANEMITDHQKAQTDLTALAKTKNVALPATLPPNLQVKYNALKQLSGADFDAAYGKEQYLSHQVTLSIQQNEVQQGQDADVKAYANVQVPIITMHTQMAKTLPAP